MAYEIPSRRELVKLADDNWRTEIYDCIHNRLYEVPQIYNFVLIIDSANPEKFDGEWVKINGEWERPDGSVPLYARALNCGKLAP